MLSERDHGDRSPRRGRIGLICALSLFASASCSDPADPPGDSTGTSTSTTSEPATSSTSDEPVTTAPGSTTDAPTTSDGPADTSTTAVDATTSADASSSGDEPSTGAPACVRNVVLMGYWPPTNEMLRPWSTNPEQNPDGWAGANWGGYGYDVYSFFPEFPPDGDPSNDKIGEPGAVGSPDFDLRVDYQATSSDFWRIVDTYQPVILVTTSRGGKIGWELEALEGGHGMGNQGGPAMDWTSDGHGDEQFPTKATIEARSWDAISTYRKGKTLPTKLPIDEIFAATDALGITSVVIDQETSGNFLSGFLGLHGLYYNTLAPQNVSAGHIHVGSALPLKDASTLIDATLHAVLQHYPSEDMECP